MLTGFPRTRWPRRRFSESYAVRIPVKISHHTTPHHTTPHHITPHHTTYRIASHRIASHRIVSYRFFFIYICESSTSIIYKWSSCLTCICYIVCGIHRIRDIFLFNVYGCLIYTTPSFPIASQCSDTIASCLQPTLLFQSLYLPNFYMNTLSTLHFIQQISKLRTQSRHYPNPIATNGAGVCQYDITNATANYNAVSMTTLGHQFKDNEIIIPTRMHHMYSKKGLWAS